MWLVAQLTKTAPKNVYTLLETDGHEIFSPKIKAPTTFRGKPAVVEKERFPGYVFLRYSHRWPTANRQGVRVLAFTDADGFWQPHVLSDDDLAAVVNHEPRQPQQDNEFRKGDYVRVISGPFTSYFGHVERRKSGAYEVGFKVMVDGIANIRVISLPAHLLELAYPTRETTITSPGASTGRISGAASA